MGRYNNIVELVIPMEKLITWIRQLQPYKHGKQSTQNT